MMQGVRAATFFSLLSGLSLASGACASSGSSAPGTDAETKARKDRALWDKEADARCRDNPEQRLDCIISLYRYSGSELRAQRLAKEREKARLVAEAEAAVARAKQRRLAIDEERKQNALRLAEAEALQHARGESLRDLVWLGVDAYVAAGGDPYVLERVQERCSAVPTASSDCVVALLDDQVLHHLVGHDTFFGARLAEAVAPLQDLALRPLPSSCDLNALVAPYRNDQTKAFYCLFFFRKGGAKPGVEDVVRRQRQQLRTYRSAEGFGKTRWGMGPRDVRRVERVRSDGQDLVGSVEVAGRRAVPRWIFHDGVLVSVQLSVQPRVMAGPLDDFFDLRALLSIKYGEPEDAFRDHVDRATLALQVLGGEQELTSQWATEDTYVELRAGRDGTSVLYACRTLWGWHVAEHEQRLKAEASKL